MSLSIDISHPDAALSIYEAARECPQKLCLRTPEGDITFAQAAQRARDIFDTLELPSPGRPYVLRADTDVHSMLVFYALLAAHVPMLLLSPKLTEAEVQSYIRAAQAIDEPLPDDAAVVIFTSGTTGPSKPAVLSRRALAANALAVGRHIEMTSEDIWLLSLSAARVGGLGILTRSLCIRSAVCIGPKYTAKNFVEQLERDRITIASLVPTMLTDVLEHYPDWTPPESFRLLLVGGAACPVNLRRKGLAAHIPIVTTYAMTETASSVAMSPYEERLTENFLADRALEGAEIRLENNQIEVRGEMLMSGYWGRSKLEKGQWLRSGDIADMDAHGGFRIRARQSEVLITGGEKVYPAEVELALEEIEGIRSALVAGIPDEKWGVIVAALLVADSDRDPLEDKAIVEGLLPRLARYKCPRRIAWVKELPKTREGKYSRTPAAFDGLKLQTLHYVNAARQ